MICVQVTMTVLQERNALRNTVATSVYLKVGSMYLAFVHHLETLGKAKACCFG